MARLMIVCLVSVTLGELATAADPQPLRRFEFSQTEMATQVRIVLYGLDSATASTAARAAFARFHQLNSILSDFDPQSELRRLCNTSTGGKPVPVGIDLWRVLLQAEELSRRSGGAFDVTVGPVVKIWRSARHTKELPSSESLRRALSRVGYQYVRLHRCQQAVELLKPNMRLDLGGIAKGYAIDEAMAVLREHGISRMMIEAGGNLGLGEPPPERPGWRIGIAPPEVRSPSREYLWLSGVTLSTSGDMWQYAVIGGKRYSHLIDPRTGQALTDHSSVTVIGPVGMNTDGLSSAVAILGPQRGLELIEGTSGTACFIVRMIDGREETYESRNWKELRKCKDEKRRGEE